MKEKEKRRINFFVDAPSDIHVKMKSLLTEAVDLMVDADIEKLEELYVEVKSSKYSGQGYLETLPDYDGAKEKCFDVGYTYALLETMRSYAGKAATDKEIERIKTKYKNKIFKCLGERGTVFHRDLAIYLGISNSALNAVIKRMNETGVKTVNVEKAGKYTLYSLTAQAYRYVYKHGILTQEEEREPRFNTLIYVKRFEDEKKREQSSLFCDATVEMGSALEQFFQMKRRCAMYHNLLTEYRKTRNTEEKITAERKEQTAGVWSQLVVFKQPGNSRIKERNKYEKQFRMSAGVY